MIRYPLPWEEDARPRRVRASLEDRDQAEPVWSVAVPDRWTDPDPSRARRGAAGAAAAHHQEVLRWGGRITHQEARERVDTARRRSAAHKERT